MLKKLFLHEKIYLFLLGLLLLGLMLSSSWYCRSSFYIFVLLVFSIWLYFTEESRYKNIFKRILPPISVPILYSVVGDVVSFLKIPKQDLLLQKIDRWLLGGNLSLKIQALAHPIVTELLYIVYILFFYYAISSVVYYARQKQEVREKFYNGLFSLYWIGFFFYVLTPATGPYVHMMHQFEAPLKEGLYFSSSIYDLVLSRNNQADIFPSLHCGISAYCLFFDWAHRKKYIYLTLIFCILIWIATLYLRYHYFIDVICGIGLAYLFFLRTNKVPVKSAFYKKIR